MKNKLTVIALGGSIMYPENIDIEYLKQFKKFIEKLVKKGHKFIIVAGGGKLARNYQNALSAIVKTNDWDKDMAGIQATRANAYLLRGILKGADPVVINEADKPKKLKYPITIGSGGIPGHSTDYDSIVLADFYGAEQVIIAGKPSHVFDKDPHAHNDAKHFAEISWANYRKMFPKKWTPGFGSPVDPIGAAFAEKRGIKAIIINGKDLKNFEDAILGERFIGTAIL